MGLLKNFFKKFNCTNVATKTTVSTVINATTSNVVIAQKYRYREVSESEKAVLKNAYYQCKNLEKDIRDEILEDLKNFCDSLHVDAKNLKDFHVARGARLALRTATSLLSDETQNVEFDCTDPEKMSVTGILVTLAAMRCNWCLGEDGIESFDAILKMDLSNSVPTIEAVRDYYCAQWFMSH